jgi:hypothetical protein
MSQGILQITIKFDLSRDEFEDICSAITSEISATPDLRCRVWLLNEIEREARGIYLFDDASAAQTVFDGLVAAEIASSRAFSDVSVKRFDVLDEPSVIGRAPVGERIVA